MIQVDAGRARCRGWRRPARLGLALLMVGGGVACSAITRPAALCLPSPLTVAPDPVVVGKSVTVSSPPFACPARYPSGKQYVLTLFLAGRGAPIPLGTVPVSADGSFIASTLVPPGAPAGGASIEVGGSAFDDCKDTAGASSCAAYVASLRLLPRA